MNRSGQKRWAHSSSSRWNPLWGDWKFSCSFFHGVFSSCEDYCRTATHWLHPAAMDIKTVGFLFGVVSVNKTTKDCLPLKIRHCAKWHFSKTFLRSWDSVVSCCCWESVGLLSLQDTISLIRLWSRSHKFLSERPEPLKWQERGASQEGDFCNSSLMTEPRPLAGCSFTGQLCVYVCVCCKFPADLKGTGVSSGPRTSDMIINRSWMVFECQNTI